MLTRLAPLFHPCRYEIPRSELTLGEMFGLLEGNKAACRILDYALSQTTLEKLFLGFAAQQEEETGGAPGIP